MSDDQTVDTADDALAAFTAENEDLLLTLAQRGTGLPDALLLNLRLDVLTDWIVGDIGRKAFEARFQMALRGLLEHWQTETTRRTLLQGVIPTTGGQHG